MSAGSDAPRVRVLGLVDYPSTWQAMVDFTAQRTAQTPDELWLCEHPPVYTLGQAGRPEHRLVDNGIPLVKIDRGGQITYHGPGQAVVYFLLDLVRRDLHIRQFVTQIEQAVIDLLGENGVALNVDMDLSPFSAINPCGYAGMAVTQTRDLGVALSSAQAAQSLAGHLIKQLERA